jgi:hypothetical protein
MLVAETATADREMISNFPSLGDVSMSELEINPAPRDFSAILRESISEGMRRVLGAGGTEAILYHIGLPSFDNPKKFHEKLSAIFGAGTASLERVILQQLHESIGFRPASTMEGDFVDQVELAKRSFDATARRHRRQ